MKARITWSHERVFVGQSGTGHGVVMSSIGEDGRSLARISHQDGAVIAPGGPIR